MFINLHIYVCMCEFASHSSNLRTRESCGVRLTRAEAYILSPPETWHPVRALRAGSRDVLNGAGFPCEFQACPAAPIAQGKSCLLLYVGPQSRFVYVFEAPSM